MWTFYIYCKPKCAWQVFSALKDLAISQQSPDSTNCDRESVCLWLGRKREFQPLCSFFSMKCALIGCIELLTVSVKSLYPFKCKYFRISQDLSTWIFKTKAFFTVG